MKAEEYTPMEKDAIKWLDETDAIQFSQMELLTMFAHEQNKELIEENKRLKNMIQGNLNDAYENQSK